MKLQSVISFPEYDFKIDHHSKILSFGSCFSDHIGSKLKTLWFDAKVNPFGVLFNPISIANLLERALDGNKFTLDEVKQRGDLHFIFDFHSQLTDINSNKVLEKANMKLEETLDYLKNSNLLLITFGTSFYYELKENKKAVANCHKMPQELFERKKIKAAAITEIYKELLQKIKILNPTIEILFTVSPIRHERDGFIENNRSKAELLLAIAELEGIKNVNYFPSYEIQMDELRDYRFYSEDLQHPNKLAIEYIFEKFISQLCNQKTIVHMQNIQKIVSQENHRILFPESEEGKKSLKNLADKKAALKALIYP